MHAAQMICHGAACLAAQLYLPQDHPCILLLLRGGEHVETQEGLVETLGSQLMGELAGTSFSHHIFL